MKKEPIADYEYLKSQYPTVFNYITQRAKKEVFDDIENKYSVMTKAWFYDELKGKHLGK